MVFVQGLRVDTSAPGRLLSLLPGNYQAMESCRGGGKSYFGIASEDAVLPVGWGLGRKEK